MCDDYNENIENQDNNPFRDPENYRNIFEFTRNLSMTEHRKAGIKTTQEKNINKNGPHHQHFLTKEEIQGGIEKYPGPPNVPPSLHHHNQMKTISTSQKSFRSRNSRATTEEPR